MNQIGHMLSGIEPGVVKNTISKNTKESNQSERFDELLKNQSEREAEEDAKSKNLFGQMVVGQAGVDISFKPFWNLNENMKPCLEVKGSGESSKSLAYDGVQPLGEGTEIERRAVFSTKEIEGEAKQEAHVRFPRMPGWETGGRGDDSNHSSERGSIDMRLDRNQSVWSKSANLEEDLRGKEAVTEEEIPKGVHPQEFFMANVDDSYKNEMKKVVENSAFKPVLDMKKLSGSMLKNITKGAREFEIFLHPKNLGSLVVKASYDQGKTVISLVSGESKVIQSILENAGELLDMLKLRLGEPIEVVIDAPAFNYLERENNHQKNQDHTWNQHEEKDFQEPEEEDSEKFLHQLRLGLM